ALGVLRVLVQDAVRDVDAAVRHRRTGVAGADRGPPHLLGALGAELLDQAALAPDAVALGPEPLRPIVGKTVRSDGCQKQHRHETAPGHDGSSTLTRAGRLKIPMYGRGGASGIWKRREPRRRLASFRAQNAWRYPSPSRFMKGSRERPV